MPHNVCVCVCAWSLSHVQLFVISQTTTRQAPLSMGISRQEYSSGLPFPPPHPAPYNRLNTVHELLDWIIRQPPLHLRVLRVLFGLSPSASMASRTQGPWVEISSHFPAHSLKVHISCLPLKYQGTPGIYRTLFSPHSHGLPI